MKKIILCTAIILTAIVFKNADAQVSISVNIGQQPQWGPAGYQHVEYYYMPDMDMYYYVPGQQWVYLQGNNWVFSANLPGRYRNYDLDNCYKVVVNEPRAYLHYRQDRVRYGRYRGYNGRQVIIRNQPRYYGSRYASYHEHGNGNGYGHYRGNAYGHYKEHGNPHDHDRRGHGWGNGKGHGRGRH